MLDSCLVCWWFMLKQCSKLLANVPRLTLHTNHSLPHPYLRQGHRNVRFHLRSKKYLYPELWLCHFLHMAFIYWLFMVVHYLHFVSAFDTSAALELRRRSCGLVLLFPAVWSHGLKASHGSIPVARHTDSWRQAFYVHHPDAQARFGHNHVEHICPFCFVFWSQDDAVPPWSEMCYKSWR